MWAPADSAVQTSAADRLGIRFGLGRVREACDSS